MIKKIQIFLALILTCLSYYFVVINGGLNNLDWLLMSLAPYMLLAALAAFTKLGFLQMLLLPFLLIYGIGSLVSVPLAKEFLYVNISALLLLSFAVRFLLRHGLRLRFIRLFMGLVLGSMLFIALKYYKTSYFKDKAVNKVIELEKNLFSSRRGG